MRNAQSEHSGTNVYVLILLCPVRSFFRSYQLDHRHRSVVPPPRLRPHDPREPARPLLVPLGRFREQRSDHLLIVYEGKRLSPLVQAVSASQRDHLVNVLRESAGACARGLNLSVPEELGGQRPEERFPLVSRAAQPVDPLSVPHGKDARAVAGVGERPADLPLCGVGNNCISSLLVGLS